MGSYNPFQQYMGQVSASRSGVPTSPYAGRTGVPTASVTPYTGVSRTPAVGSSSYTAPTTSGYTTASGRSPTVPSTSGGGYAPSAATNTTYPTGQTSNQLQQSPLAQYWNSYAPANQQGAAMSTYRVNPDGTVTYGFADKPGQMYTKSPQDFNAMMKSMSSFTNQASGGNVPMYQGAYLPTNVPGQAYGGSQSDWSQSAYSANSPYYPAGKSFTQANPQGGAPQNPQTSFNPYGQQQNPYTTAAGRSGGYSGGQQQNLTPSDLINAVRMLAGDYSQYPSVSSGISNMLSGAGYNGSQGYQSPQYVGVGGNQSRYGQQDPYAQLMSMLQGGQQTPNYYGY